MIDNILGFNTIVAALDIVIVAFILYWLMLMFKGTRAGRMLWGIAIIVVVYFVSQRFELLTLHWILSNFLGSIVIFIIVVFQQDIRRALVQMGKPFSTREATKAGGVLDIIVRAAKKMSETRTGGIIVLERSIELGDFIGEDAGVELDARVSKELLLSIFNSTSPVHDGAVIIRNGRVSRAGAILPLTSREISNPSLGTRHRAAIGLAEETDAAIIVVSEETGGMTLVFEDGIYPDLSAEKLLSDLKQLFAFKGYPRKAMVPWRAPSK